MLRELKLDNLGIEVFETREEMGEQAGKDIAAYMRELLETQETVNVMFAAAPSQNETLKTLCSQNIPWERVNAFHMDEYVGLDAGHPSGFRNYLKRTIFDRFTFCSVNLIDGNAKDPEQAVNEYDALLRDHSELFWAQGKGVVYKTLYNTCLLYTSTFSIRYWQTAAPVCSRPGGCSGTGAAAA